MGVAESKVALKTNILRLADSEGEIGENESEFWQSFYSYPESALEVFQLITSANIRKCLLEKPQNLAILLRKVSGFVIDFSNFSVELQQQNKRSLLNCVRILTRILPFIFELETDDFERELFWSQESPNLGPVLGERLVKTFLSLLFFPGLTLPSDTPIGDIRVWEKGIGVSSAPTATAEIDSNRSELLKLLLVLLSKPMYTKPENLLTTSDCWTALVVSIVEQKLVSGLFYSLLNVTLNYAPNGWIPYDHVLFRDYREPLVQICAEVLVVLVNCKTVPAESTNDSEQVDFNLFADYLSKLQQKVDFELIIERLGSLLANPMQSSYLPYSIKTIVFFEEILALFWKLMELNHAFKEFVCSHEKALDISAALVYQMLSSKNDPSKYGLLRLCAYAFHLLSSEREYALLLNKQYNDTFHVPLGVPHFRGNFADLIILSFHHLIFSSNGSLSGFNELFLTIISNISPFIKSLSVTTSNKLLHAFTAFSSPVYLFSAETRHVYIFYLLETFNNILQYQYEGNSCLAYEILRNKDKFKKLSDLKFEDALSSHEEARRKRNMTESSDRQDGEVEDFNEKGNLDIDELILSEPTSPRLISPDIVAQFSHAAPQRLHQDIESQAFSPQLEWFNFWYSQLPLSTILAFISKIGPELEQLCEENHWTDDLTLEHLRSTTVVGLLPVPHPILIRNFNFHDGVYVWFTSYIMGVIYLRHVVPLPSIWLGSDCDVITKLHDEMIFDQVKTGDIVLFSDSYLLTSRLTRLGTGTIWTHVAIVVRWPLYLNYTSNADEDIFIWEIGHSLPLMDFLSMKRKGSGARLVRLSDKLRHYARRGNKICIMSLQTPFPTINLMQWERLILPNMLSILHSWREVKFRNNPRVFLRAAFSEKPWKTSTTTEICKDFSYNGNSMDPQKLHCAEAIALILQRLGIMKQSHLVRPELFNPGDFGTRSLKRKDFTNTPVLPLRTGWSLRPLVYLHLG